MAIALIALLLVEAVLLVLWVPACFDRGIVLFNQRIAASPAMQARLSLGSLERDLQPDRWMPLAFHLLPDGSLAIRESIGPGFDLRYYPVMRGHIVLNARRHEVRLTGRCSWFVAVFSMLVLPMVAMRPTAAPLLLLLPMFLASYLIQKRRYARIVEVLRLQVKSTFPRQPG